MNTASTLRINISFPTDLAKEVRKITSEGEFSKFLADAAREKIASTKREKALLTLLKSNRAFPSIKDSSKWVSNLRKKDINRLKRFRIHE